MKPGEIPNILNHLNSSIFFSNKLYRLNTCKEVIPIRRIDIPYAIRTFLLSPWVLRKGTNFGRWHIHRFENRSYLWYSICWLVLTLLNSVLMQYNEIETYFEIFKVELKDQVAKLEDMLQVKLYSTTCIQPSI